MITKYIGIPYNIHNSGGLNCWGLVCCVYNDLGYKLKDFPSNTENPQELAIVFSAAFATGDHGYEITENPQDYDLAVFSRPSVFGVQYHCGLLVDGRVLHCSNKTGSVVYQRMEEAKKSFKEVVFWRKS